MAAARQKEIKDRATVVATTTLVVVLVCDGVEFVLSMKASTGPSFGLRLNARRKWMEHHKFSWMDDNHVMPIPPECPC
jgi:hypothetical protein